MCKIDESQKQYAKWKKPNIKDYIMYILNSIYMKSQKRKTIMTKQINGCQRREWQGDNLLQMHIKELFRVIKVSTKYSTT